MFLARSLAEKLKGPRWVLREEGRRASESARHTRVGSVSKECSLACHKDISIRPLSMNGKRIGGFPKRNVKVPHGEKALRAAKELGRLCVSLIGERETFAICKASRALMNSNAGIYVSTSGYPEMGGHTLKRVPLHCKGTLFRVVCLPKKRNSHTHTHTHALARAGVWVPPAPCTSL